MIFGDFGVSLGKPGKDIAARLSSLVLHRAEEHGPVFESHGFS